MNLVIIGLTGTEIAHWKDLPDAPTLATLHQEGVFGILRSAPVENSSDFWTCILSGQDPEQAGTQTRSPLIWDFLREEMQTAAILIDVPIAEPGPSALSEGCHVVNLHSSASTDNPISRSRSRFQTLGDSLNRSDCRVFMLVDEHIPDGSDRSRQLDSEIAETLSRVPDRDGETLILVVSFVAPRDIDPDSAPEDTRIGSFLLLSSLGTARGTAGDARPEDLSPTILSFAGRPVPASMTGRPIAFGTAPGPDDEERSVEHRLRGLGYLA